MEKLRNNDIVLSEEEARLFLAELFNGKTYVTQILKNFDQIDRIESNDSVIYHVPDISIFKNEEVGSV